MERIGDDVRRAVKRLGPGGAMAAIVRAWPGAVGPAVAANAWPARVARDGTLHVATRSSTWAFELAGLEAEIADRLRSAIGEEAPKRLRFAPGRLPEPAVEGHSETRPAAPTPGAGELRAAAEVAAAIEDPDLRETVARAVAASLASAGSDRRF